jgi:methylmalonyl-CoA mutase
VSSLAAGHRTLVPALRKELDRLGRGDVVIVVGGVVPKEDIEPLRAAGAEMVFGPGTVVFDAAASLIELLRSRSAGSKTADAKREPARGARGDAG